MFMLISVVEKDLMFVMRGTADQMCLIKCNFDGTNRLSNSWHLMIFVQAEVESVT